MKKDRSQGEKLTLSNYVIWVSGAPHDFFLGCATLSKTEVLYAQKLVFVAQWSHCYKILCIFQRAFYSNYRRELIFLVCFSNQLNTFFSNGANVVLTNWCFKYAKNTSVYFKLESVFIHTLVVNCCLGGLCKNVPNTCRTVVNLNFEVCT